MQNHINCRPAIENEDPEVKYERIPEADKTIISPSTIKTPAEPSNQL